MAFDDIVPETLRVVFPYQRGVAYSEIASVDQIAEIRGYTFFETYAMIRSALEAAGVDRDRISWEYVVFFMREILNDYSAEVGEFLQGIEYRGGGAIFKIPALREIHHVSVNGYTASKVAETVMTAYRAAETTLSSSSWIYSVVGTLMNVYPAIGDSDTIVVLASLYADDINEDAGDTILPHIDSSALYHGTLWKCLANQQKPFVHEQAEYMQIRSARASKVASQVVPATVRPYSLL